MFEINTKNDVIPINEIFNSIQGEGVFAGYPAKFIRVAGCNLAKICKYCDTDFTRNTVLTKNEFRSILEKSFNDNKLVVITGGEPLMYRDVFEKWLAEVLPFFRNIVQFETNGTFEPLDVSGVTYVVSPKRGIKIHDKWFDLPFDKRVGVFFKFVVGDVPDDSLFWTPDEIRELLSDWIEKDVTLSQRVYLMPYGATVEELNKNDKIVWNLVQELGVRYSDRLHIRVFNKERRGV